jgi:hypothetical protein
MGLGEGEERIGHEILRVSWREIAGERPEQVELSALREGLMPRRHSETAISVRSGRLRHKRLHLTLGGQHVAARIGGRGDGARAAQASRSSTE